jgi:dGTP triphosphohydrolase
LTNLHHQPKETSLFDKPSLSSEGDQSIRQTFALFRKRTVYSTNLRHLQKETSLFDKLSPYSEGEQSIRQTFAIFRRRPVYSTNLRHIQKETSLFDKPSPSTEGPVYLTAFTIYRRTCISDSLHHLQKDLYI